jgi:hypothetical protein
LLPPGVQYCNSAYDAAKGADAIVIATEWQEFTKMDFGKLKTTMRAPILVDLRNILNEEQVRRSGFSYFGIGGRRRQAFEKLSPRLVSTQPFWRDASTMTEGEELLLQGIAAAE